MRNGKQYKLHTRGPDDSLARTTVRSYNDATFHDISAS